LACVSAASANKKPPLRAVSLNTATASELQEVPGNWAVDGGQNSENAQVVRAVQERGRIARDQRHWPEAHGKNAQVHYSGVGRAEKTSEQRDRAIHRETFITFAAENRESESAALSLILSRRHIVNPNQNHPPPRQGRGKWKAAATKSNPDREHFASLHVELLQVESVSSEYLVSFLRLLDAEWDLLGDADAVTFQGHYFFRVIGEHTNISQAEVD
jgi:hypothetical protein